MLPGLLLQLSSDAVENLEPTSAALVWLLATVESWSQLLPLPDLLQPADAFEAKKMAKTNASKTLAARDLIEDDSRIVNKDIALSPCI